MWEQPPDSIRHQVLHQFLNPVTHGQRRRVDAFQNLVAERLVRRVEAQGPVRFKLVLLEELIGRRLVRELDVAPAEQSPVATEVRLRQNGDLDRRAGDGLGDLRRQWCGSIQIGPIPED